jgi:arsenate reductase
MAEGFLRALDPDRYEADSAGTEKTCVNPLAIRAMAERGIDIGGHTSKRYDDLPPARWDYLITVCDDANERCPVFPGAATRLHWSFEDPSRATGSDADRLAVFRRVRDQIEERITQWVSDRQASRAT